MRAVHVAEAGADFELIDRPTPEPGRDQVLVRVTACGVCHSDAMAQGGMASDYPRIPGHEVAGTIESIGEGVTQWQPGQRVGIGWFGGACHTCTACREGDFINCATMGITGLTLDGGYAEHILVPSDALAAIPDELTDVEAAPLMCAGITVFNGLRESNARAGDLVAVIGLGGLGHLGVQFANKMGFEVVSIARGAEKGDFAKQLGAHHYLDSTAVDVAEELTKLGGAATVLSTITNAEATTAPLGGLRHRGQLVIVGVPEDPLNVPAVDLIMKSSSVAGHASGTAKDSEDTLRFAALTGVRPMVETAPLTDAASAFEKMMEGKARFRMVLTT